MRQPPDITQGEIDTAAFRQQVRGARQDAVDAVIAQAGLAPHHQHIPRFQLQPSGSGRAASVRQS